MNKRKTKMKNNTGFTLIELLVSVCILLLVTLFVIELFPCGFRMNARSRAHSVACFLAQSKMEEIVCGSVETVAAGEGTFASFKNNYIFEKYSYKVTKETLPSDPGFMQVKVTVSGPLGVRSVLSTIFASAVFAGCASTPGAEFIWVPDPKNKKINCFDTLSGAWVVQVPVNAGGQDISPTDIAVDIMGTKVFVVSKDDKKVLWSDNGGSTWNDITPPGIIPSGIASDFTGDKLIVADQASNKIYWCYKGAWSSTSPLPDDGIPLDVALNGYGEIGWVTDEKNNRILCVDDMGQFYIPAGDLPDGGTPGGIGVDISGQKVWVADTSNNCLRMFNAAVPGWDANTATPPSGSLTSLALDMGGTVIYVHDTRSGVCIPYSLKTDGIIWEWGSATPSYR
ncbi:MAG: prepilin-type N-terminal cleavage/methylation domain-containing protein [Armatimonadota bacterium]